MKTGLVWFKNDLRLQDNEVLCQAISQCDQVVCCFCLEPHLFDVLEIGFRKTDINRFKFLEKSIEDLIKNIEAIGGHLIICSEGAVKEIPKLIEKFNVSTIFAEQEYAYEELQIIDELQKSVNEVEFNFYWGKTLYHIDDIPFEISEIPLTSKAYRIPTSKLTKPRKTYKIPDHLVSHPQAASTKFPSPTEFGFHQTEYENTTPLMIGGEDEALKRLHYYTFESELLTGYRWSRNKSLGLDYSSKLSPYLALGCLSPRTIYEAVQDYEKQIKKNQSTWWLIFELVWRDYFTFKGMRFGKSIFFTSGIKNRKVDFQNDLTKFKRWQEGKTGIPFIDAHMRQLNLTGYMSNRGRVNCASYFVKDLSIDWTWGASYFESKLIDYDLSANWLNWHMQTFEMYYTNPVHQSLKYSANEYITKWIPELNHIQDNKIHAPWLFEDVMKETEYPKPIEVYSKWTRSINRILKTLDLAN